MALLKDIRVLPLITLSPTVSTLWISLQSLHSALVRRKWPHPAHAQPDWFSGPKRPTGILHGACDFLNCISECHSGTICHTGNATKRHSVSANYDVSFHYSDVGNSEADKGYTWSNVDPVESPGKILCYKGVGKRL